jgi:hypothetical protein
MEIVTTADSVGRTRSLLGGVADDHSVASWWTRNGHETIISDEVLDSELTRYKTSRSRGSSMECVDRTTEESAAKRNEYVGGEKECDYELEDEYEYEEKQHLRWFAHGKPWTLIAIFISWAGVILSLYSRYSLQFVTLDEPILIDPIFDYVDSIGMVRMKVCYNGTVVDDMSGCRVIPLSSEIVHDSRFDAARVLLTLGVLFGIFFATVLSTAIYWESINLRPIGVGFLFAYFCQSFSMLFFDTEVCAANKCRPGVGCIYCIVASFCWITACVATAKMDAVKSGHARRRRRLAQREAKQAAKLLRKKLQRETSTATEQTASTSSSNNSKTTSSSSSNSSHQPAGMESGEEYELHTAMRKKKMRLDREASSDIERTASTGTSRPSLRNVDIDIERGEGHETPIDALYEC